MKNTFLEKMKNSEKAIGSFSELCSPYSVECMGIAGLDYVIIDMEHGPCELHDAVEGIKAALLRGMTPLVRISSIERASVLRLLDVGAMGLIVPFVQGVDDVKKLIRYGKFPPSGERGLAFARSSGWGHESWISDLSTYFSVCNEEQILIPQCETLGCLNELEEIVALPEVAGIFIGPFDLSCALGCPGATHTPEFKDIIRSITDKCHAAGKFCMIYASCVAEAGEYFKMGIDSVAVGMDSSLYINMYKTIISQINSI